MLGSGDDDANYVKLEGWDLANDVSEADIGDMYVEKSQMCSQLSLSEAQCLVN